MKPVSLTVDEYAQWAAGRESVSLGGSGALQDRWKQKLTGLGLSGGVADMQDKWTKTKFVLVGQKPLHFVGQTIVLRKS